MKKLVCYSATWCGPCKMFKPTLDSLIAEGYNIEVINLDEDEAKAIENNVHAVPTFILYEDDVELGRVSGVPTKEDVIGWFK